jgi:oligopeptide transport system ATP-binding protein
VEIDDQVVAEVAGRDLRDLRRRVQIVFQDPYSALNPRMSVGRLISEGWRIHGDQVSTRERERRVAELLSVVGLAAATAHRYPHQLSGGQLQRVSLARALAVRPEILICDEPTSALDVSVQAQVLNLLDEIKDEFALSCVFISHDLGVVGHVADRVAVMYLGQVVELGDTAEVLQHPQHPYTARLLETVPRPAWEISTTRDQLAGEVTLVPYVDEGCRFRDRCPKAQERCAVVAPTLTAVTTPGHTVACHFPEIGIAATAVAAPTSRRTTEDVTFSNPAR